jgi:hypothetical protein
MTNDLISILVIVVGVFVLGGLLWLLLGRPDHQMRNELAKLSDKQLHETEAHLAILHLRGEVPDATYADMRSELEYEAGRRRERARSHARFEQAKIIGGGAPDEPKNAA